MGPQKNTEEKAYLIRSYREADRRKREGSEFWRKAWDWIWTRRRILASLWLGLIAAYAAPFAQVSNWTAMLIGWDLGALLYVVWAWMLFFSLGEDDIRMIASREDEDRGMILVLMLAAIGVSLLAIFLVLAAAPGAAGGVKPVAMPLAIATLILSWCLLHTLFILHYAHLYFGDEDENGVPNGGIEFPYGGNLSYLDFAYFVVNLACANQNSDVATKSREFRNLIIIHTLISYVFNTVVIAVGVNIASNFLK
jgi:uncharacterized membrane protein